VSEKYKEIFKLKKMLEDVKIPFSWNEGWGYGEEELKELRKIAPDLIEHYQICYPIFDCEYRWISVIEGFGTYGAEKGKLEIMGGLTQWEKDVYSDEVVGYLTAYDVFQRIKNHWEENKMEVIKIDPVTFDVIENNNDTKKEVIEEFLQQGLGNYTPEEFCEKYKKWKQAEAEFESIYNPLKERIIETCNDLNNTDTPLKKIIIGDLTLTYVSPSVRKTVDTKKLKEEEPELVKRFMKSTNVAATVKITENNK
jgi:hypothetical protein